ncbi:MAG: FeoB small GTPase domain-containing protein [Limnothrix sp.]|jgi:ferrous iron transport protein B|uniref:FeoB small GTPase domain-containing protein n=1 Tax=unclassified Limnothrix TaxID=2632864 RepID=UPI00081D7F0C|nr:MULTISPECIES: FeoB small GTPase domain-containing protein [unclassified Limnothrix]MEB3118890.1 FeoB small GTPase domain-containing protein [Limnothrix sp.]OCQ98534.1 iron transporter FeoB [Limnothrix sp. P13C2]MBD2553948.1 50S ribosome-binding GTPase [Limnothrix sp. FACHB-708]MBD2590970.1 50S ribosome-binding GTPase [Limnothrix sp. FACHB-406]MBD2635553.1 50S ribosome-binding GTPase [Limnothrix sp. FACHB-881]
MDCHQCHQNNGSCGSKRSLRWLPFGENFNRPPIEPSGPQVALVGMPNVGKSVLFHALTGTYVTVSNYPGTTVEVTRGAMTLDDRAVSVIDTPGMYSLLPISEEERVARDLLMSEPFGAIVHVLDAKNLGRMLALTVQLLEAELPVIVAVNMMDEAQRWGLTIDREALIEELGVPVVLMAAARNWGVDQLRETLADRLASTPAPVLAAVG